MLFSRSQLPASVLAALLLASTLPPSHGFATFPTTPAMLGSGRLPRRGYGGGVRSRARLGALSMGVEQWKESKLAGAESNILGCLPFPMDDILLVKSP